MWCNPGCNGDGALSAAVTPGPSRHGVMVSSYRMSFQNGPLRAKEGRLTHKGSPPKARESHRPELLRKTFLSGRLVLENAALALGSLNPIAVIGERIFRVGCR